MNPAIQHTDEMSESNPSSKLVSLSVAAAAVSLFAPRVRVRVAWGA